MKNKKELLERIDIMTKDKDLECYIILSDTGCGIHGKGDEVAAMFAALVSELKKYMPTKAIREAFKIGLTVDDEDISEEKKEVEKLEKDMKLAEKLLKVLKGMEDE